MGNFSFSNLQYLLLALLVMAVTGCGASNSASNAGSGAVAAKLQWGESAKTSAKTLGLVPVGVTKIRLTLSGAGIPTVRKEVAVIGGTTSQAQLDGIYPGTMTLSVQALGASGTSLYEGFVLKVVVNAGQTTDVGTIAMTPPLEKVQDQECISCHETTPDAAGQNLVAKFKQSGHYSNAAWTSNAKHGVTGTGCAGCHGPQHNDSDPVASGRCNECHSFLSSKHQAVDNNNCSACHDPHNTTSANGSYNLEDFRTLLKAPQVAKNSAGRDVAAGSDICLVCHTEMADWVNTPHTQKAQKGKEYVIGYNADPALYTRAAKWITDNRYTYLHPKNKDASGNAIDSTKLGVRAVMTEKPTVTYSDQTFGVDDIAIAIGSNYKQAYAVWMPGYGYKVLNIRYNSIGLSAEAMGDRTDERTWEGSCIGCHLTGYDPTNLPAAYKDSATAYDLNPYIRDMRTGCDACHGPATGQTGHAVNSADLTQDQQIDICGRCHGNWNPTVPGTTARKDVHEFKPGDSLVYLLSPSYNGGVDRLMRPTWGTATKEFSASGAAIDDHMEWYNFKIGKHYGKSYNGKPVTCTSCHDPHKNNPGRNYGRRILKGDYNFTTGVASICNECHPNAGYGVTKKGVAGALNPHTAKPYGVGLDTIPTDPTAKWPWE